MVKRNRFRFSFLGVPSTSSSQSLPHHFFLSLLLLLVTVSVSTRPSTFSAQAQEFASMWSTAREPLTTARSLAAVIFFNQTFVITGGCTDATCHSLSKAVDVYYSNESVRSAGDLPLVVQYGRERMHVGIAGAYSTVAVGTYNFDSNEIKTQVWVVGACSLHFQDEVSAIDELKFRSLWPLTDDLSGLTQPVVKIHNSIPLRVNASCAAFGGNIYIVGGYFPHNDTLTSSVDVFNVGSGSYSHNVFQHTERVMNAAVTIDNEMLYIAGGQTRRHDGRGGSNRKFLPSSYCRAYHWPPLFIINESLPMRSIALPNNTNAVVEAGMGVHYLPALFVFAGDLVWVIDTAVHYTLSLTADVNSVLQTRWVRHSGTGTGVAMSTQVALPQPDVEFGTFLAFFSFGGISTVESTTAIYFRPLSLRIPAPQHVPTTISAGRTLHLYYSPYVPGNWWARLSPDIACYGSTDLIHDEELEHLSVDFVPNFPTNEMYLCLGRRATAVELVNHTFFAVSDPYASISVLPNIVSFAPPTSSVPSRGDITGQSSDRGTIIFAVVLGLLVTMGVIGAVVAFQRAKRLQASLEDGLLDDDGDAQTDSLVRNTTSDSRYRVLRRIGAGSFSTVFLVARKTDGEQFALKFMACVDDRERLDAIKECETINSLQGHPNVITLYDMFMSYEFERKDSNLMSDDGSPEKILAMHRDSTLDAGYGTLAGPPVTPKGGQRHKRTESNGSGDRTTPRSQGSSSGPPVHTRFLCLVMEYHPAGDLAHWVLDAGYRDDGVNQGMSEASIISVAYQLCSVLKHLHLQKPPVVHRDLKPENVLLRGSPSRKDTFLPIIVTDFGLAFIQEENRKGGKGGGTRPYIAPECWRGGVSTAADIWSLGCVLYAIATQRVTADTVRVMFLDARSPHFHDDIQYDLRVHRYSEKFARFVASLLVVDPKHRPTAAELLARFSSGGATSPSTVRLS